MIVNEEPPIGHFMQNPTPLIRRMRWNPISIYPNWQASKCPIRGRKQASLVVFGSRRLPFLSPKGVMWSPLPTLYGICAIEFWIQWSWWVWRFNGPHYIGMEIWNRKKADLRFETAYTWNWCWVFNEMSTRKQGTWCVRELKMSADACPLELPLPQLSPKWAFHL